MTKNVLLLIAATLIVLGVVSFAFLNGSEPEPECAKDASQTSGFVDDDSGCQISLESMKAIDDYRAQPKFGRIAGIVLVLAGTGVGVVAHTRRRSSPSGGPSVT